MPKALGEFDRWRDANSLRGDWVNEVMNDILDEQTSGDHDGGVNAIPLIHELPNVWSRRITGRHRMVYCLEDERVIVFSVRGRYWPDL